MSDSEDSSTQPRRTAALAKKSWWPGWIWAVPIAALGITAWLLVREISTGGTDVTVIVADASGMKVKDTKVLYRGVEVGHVSDIALAKDGEHVIAHLDIDDSAKKYLNSGTRFYIEGGQPSFSDLSSLKSIIAGPSIAIVPGEGQPTREFSAITGKPPEPLAVALPYIAEFDGDVGDLKVGAPVMLRGFTVGEIDDVRLIVDPKTGQITTPVILMLDPTRLNIPGGPPADSNWTALMNATLTTLVHKGLRARLTQTPPLIGSRQIALDMVADAGQADLRLGGRYPEIPTVEGGGFESLVKQAGQLPLGDIGNNVKAITERVKSLVSSPQLNDTLDHLDRTVAAFDKTMREAGPQIAPAVRSLHQTIDSLRATANEIDATVGAMTKVIGGNPASPNGNLQQTMIELSNAGRAVRSLADYLDQHPESLIKGR